MWNDYWILSALEANSYQLFHHIAAFFFSLEKCVGLSVTLTVMRVIGKKARLTAKINAAIGLCWN